MTEAELLTQLDELEAAAREALDASDTDQLTVLADTMEAIEGTIPEKAPVSLLDAALWYASQGLRVFPLSPLSKIPYKGSRGCKDATSDPDQIRAWWAAAPDANIGLATGHLVDVVDFDGPTGMASLAQHYDQFADLHILGVARTPRPGGHHWYVPATGHGNRAGIYPGIDYRGEGGYVVVPPSRTDIGHYRFNVRGLDINRKKEEA